MTEYERLTKNYIKSVNIKNNNTFLTATLIIIDNIL